MLDTDHFSHDIKSFSNRKSSFSSHTNSNGDTVYSYLLDNCVKYADTIALNKSKKS